MRCVADQRHAAVTPTRSCEGCSALGEGVALPAVVDGVRLAWTWRGRVVDVHKWADEWGVSWTCPQDRCARRDVARRRVQQQRRRGLVPVLAAAAHLTPRGAGSERARESDESGATARWEEGRCEKSARDCDERWGEAARPTANMGDG